MKEKITTIGLTTIITLILSWLIGLITNNLIIRSTVLVVLLIATIIVLLKKFKALLGAVTLSAGISVIVSLLVSTNLLGSILVSGATLTIALIMIIAISMVIAKGPKCCRAVAGMILIATILTWILPITYYNYGIVEEARQGAGIFDVLSYATVTISYFGNICLYILAIGGFYGVIQRIDAYRNLLDRIVKGFKGKENIFMIIIMVLFAVITSVTGLSIGILFLFPFVISIILLMGYNKITAVMTTAGSVLVGLIGSTYSYGNTSQISQILSVKPTTEIIAKIIILAISLIILIYNVLSYAKKHRDTKKISKDPSYIPVTKDKKAKVWPLVVVVDIIILIMILSYIPWSETFGLKIFTDATNAVKEFKVFGFALPASILGTFQAFGAWTLTELLITIVIGITIIGLIYKVKTNDFLDNFVEGAKRAIKPAAIVALIYTVLILVTYHPVMLTILKPILTLTSGLNVFTMSLVAFISSVFNVEMAYAANSVLPYVLELISKSDVYPLIAIIWQSMYGLAMLVAPTSVILLATLSFMHISYGEWLKAIWKLFVELLIVLLIIFTIIFLI